MPKKQETYCNGTVFQFSSFSAIVIVHCTIYIPLFNKPKHNEILNHLNENFFSDTAKILTPQTEGERCYLKFALKYFIMQNETNIFFFKSELTLTYSFLQFKTNSYLYLLTLRGMSADERIQILLLKCL